ncbi:MAG: hypothetical protein NTU93_01975 [Arthrobacter sp.]|nr:hypothetical protein [Arthrobacter sp.]
MAAPGSIIQKAATIGAHHSALAYRARKLGLLAPPTPRPGNGKATARKAKTGLDRAWEDASKNLRKNAEIMAGAPETKAPEGRCQGVVSAADIDAQSPLSPLQEELHRMGNIVHNFRGLSAAGRTWVLSRLTADQAA